MQSSVSRATRGQCATSVTAAKLAATLLPRQQCSRARRRCESVIALAVKAVIFDMDGVLTASEGLSRLAAASVFKQLYQLDVQPEEFIPFGGMGEDKFLGGIAGKYAVQGYDAQAAKECFFETYITLISHPDANITYPGAIDLVRACRAVGLKTAVGSSAELVKVNANLATAGFDRGAFDAVVAADNFEAIKPAPDIFLAAAELAGVEPADCIVVEDAVAGIQAARNAGMRVIGVHTTLTEAEMKQCHPDLIRPDISRITLTDITTL